MEKTSKSYKDLVVWQKAIAAVTEIYRLTEKFPLIIARNLGYLSEQEIRRLSEVLSEVCKMLHGLIKKLRFTEN